MRIEETSGWSPKADQRGFIAVHPNGGIVNGQTSFLWNIYEWASSPDDDGFLLALINRLKTEYNINPNRVYMTGHSNGASMTNTFAFAHADVLAAIAPSQGAWMTSACLPIDPNSTAHPRPNRRLPFYFIRDETEVGSPTACAPRDITDFQMRDWWVQHNGVNPTAQILNQTDGTYNYRTEVYAGAAEVRFTVVLNRNHPYYVQYTDKIWDEFFSRFVRRSASVKSDFDGDGRSDVSVFRPSDSVWYLNRSTAGFAATRFGVSTDIPAPADFDGDGKTDISVFRQNEGTWYLLQSTQGFTARQFGANGDVPIPAAY